MDKKLLKRVLIFSILVSAASYFGYMGYVLYRYMTTDDLGVCGFSNGPCYGIPTSLKLKKQKVDHYLDCPNGKIGFLHTKDKEFPVIFKIDEQVKLRWAYCLQTDTCSGIPLLKMSGMRFDHEDKYSIGFFNNTYSEPGEIQLNEDYDFEYVCLSPM